MRTERSSPHVATRGLRAQVSSPLSPGEPERERRELDGAAEEHDKELFLKAFASMTKERKGDYEDILAAYNRMEKSFARDQAVLKKRDEQLDKFEVANNQEDNTIKSGGNMLSSVNSTSDEKQMLSMVAMLKNADGDKAVDKEQSDKTPGIRFTQHT